MKNSFKLLNIKTQKNKLKFKANSYLNLWKNKVVKNSKTNNLFLFSSYEYSTAKKPAPEFYYQELFEHENKVETEYYRLDEASKYVSEVQGPDNETFLKIGPKALEILSSTANRDVAHLLRSGHLQQIRNILDDKEASENDRFVALTLLKNANIASSFILPSCQDTGTAIVLGKKGGRVLTDGKDEESLSRGIYDTYVNTNLRYSQVAPLTMFNEKNTSTNLPAQIDLFSDGNKKEYNFLFMQKGGGSANKTFLYQKTKSLLNPQSLSQFLTESIKSIGTSACPPYHLALVIGGLSAELNLKTVKLASARYYDFLPTTGNEHGRAFRDLEMEQEILKITRELGIGAQFGGKYFCHDVRVIRLPRHGASCPVGLGVSCSADRQIKGKINKDGVFLELLEKNPAKFLPEITETSLNDSNTVNVNLDAPMTEILSTLDKLPTKTRVNLTGTLIVARDIAHAKLLEILEKTGKLPEYMIKYPVYYAGPAKTPKGFASGSFGPTTAGRMDSYVDKFMEAGGSKVMLAKGNRSKAVTNACKKYGGFYLGSIGGPAAILAQESIKKVEVLDFEDLGMEAVWKIQVENFPAFVVVDNKGNDFFEKWSI
eukprot:TRINITY_DN2301_c0_g1_i1.p1 TRINITY_DN2301_c0_g1~~TRINITY_DN2301_c0_g1_i1.p1  ORF type:complete len:600 (-),score=190.51 TRINITY_DN2301_c0_g1_i1:33-1832(-)